MDGKNEIGTRTGTGTGFDLEKSKEEQRRVLKMPQMQLTPSVKPSSKSLVHTLSGVEGVRSLLKNWVDVGTQILSSMGKAESPVQRVVNARLKSVENRIWLYNDAIGQYDAIMSSSIVEVNDGDDDEDEINAKLNEINDKISTLNQYTSGINTEYQKVISDIKKANDQVNRFTATKYTLIDDDLHEERRTIKFSVNEREIMLRTMRITKNGKLPNNEDNIDTILLKIERKRRTYIKEKEEIEKKRSTQRNMDVKVTTTKTSPQRKVWDDFVLYAAASKDGEGAKKFDVEKLSGSSELSRFKSRGFRIIFKIISRNVYVAKIVPRDEKTYSLSDDYISGFLREIKIHSETGFVVSSSRLAAVYTLKPGTKEDRDRILEKIKNDKWKLSKFEQFRKMLEYKEIPEEERWKKETTALKALLKMPDVYFKGKVHQTSDSLVGKETDKVFNHILKSSTDSVIHDDEVGSNSWKEDTKENKEKTVKSSEMNKKIIKFFEFSSNLMKLDKKIKSHGGREGAEEEFIEEIDRKLRMPMGESLKDAPNHHELMKFLIRIRLDDMKEIYDEVLEDNEKLLRRLETGTGTGTGGAKEKSKHEFFEF